MVGKMTELEEFEIFWKAYPRRLAKKNALRAFIKARKETTLEAILSKLEQLQQSEWSKRELQYIPHPATWLNRGGWDDEVPRQIEQGLEKIITYG